MLYGYSGFGIVPGTRDAVETYENQFWFGRREAQLYEDKFISGAARDTGNTANTAVLRPGLLMGEITASGMLKQWDPTATDGSQRIFGILDTALNMQRLGANQDRITSQVFMSGLVFSDKLIIPGNANLGITGDAQEFNVRTQLFYRNISLVEAGNAFQNHPFGGWMNLTTKTANYTVLTSDNNTLFDNRGAAGAVTFTLPTTPYLGLRYGFYVVADQSVTVTAAAGKLVAYNNNAATSVAISTALKKVGAMIELVADGTSWRLIMHMPDAAQVVTIA